MAFTVFIVIMSLLIVCANIVNIATLRATRRLPTNSRYFMQSLAAADLGVGIITAFAIHPSLEGGWPYGELACRILGGSWTIFSGVSVLSLVSISVERYLAVVFPLRYHSFVTARRCAVAIGLLWAVTVSIATYFVSRKNPPYYSYSAASFVCLPECLGDDCNAYLSPGSAIYVLIPSVLMPFIYASIVYVARKHQKRINGRQDSYGNAMATRDSIHIRVDGRTRRNLRAAKISCVVTGVFYLSWIPMVTRTYLSRSGVHVSSHAEFTTTWLAFANSLWNFVIYSVMSKGFRSTLARAVTTVCLKRTYVEEFSV